MGEEMNALALGEARDWIGTPYLHQGSQKGGGTDCLGLIRGVWRALHGGEPALVPAYTADWGEAAGEELLRDAAERLFHLKPLEAPAPGDLLLFRMQRGAPAKHLGLQGEIGASPSFLHAYGGHAVVESPLSAPWARRIVGRYGWLPRG